MKEKHKIIVGITGASGAIYAKTLLEKLDTIRDQVEEVGIIVSDYALEVWKHELAPFEENQIPFPVYRKDDFTAPFASGSSGFDIMIICPCSMGTLGRIAGGISNDLITRAADVILKERQKLLLITREAPLNNIHIQNMKTITEAGGIIFPASPSFYSKPNNIQELIHTVVDRVLSIAGFSVPQFQWGKDDLS